MVEEGANNAAQTKCMKAVAVLLVGKINALTLGLGLLRPALLTAVRAASARRVSKETTTAHAVNFALSLVDLIRLPQVFLWRLS